MKTGLKLGLAATVLIVGVGAWVWQKQRATELEKTISDLRQTGRDAAAGAARRNEVALQTQIEVATQIRQEIEKTRKDIVGLETALKPPLLPKASNDGPFTANRDPEKGPVRVEHFRNVGQATPAAAFQTVIWALAGDEGDALASLLGLSPAGREKLQAIVTRMPLEKQARFRPAEKVIGMLLALDFLKEDGFQIGAASEPDAAGQVKLSVLRARNGRSNLLEKKLPFQHGPAGWQLPITDAMIDSIPASIEQASMYVPPKRTGN